MPNLKLGKKSNDMYAIHVSLPKGIIEMKSYCKVNGGSLSLTDYEFKFALASGADKLIASSVLAVSDGVVEVAAPVVAKAPEAKVEAKAPVIVEDLPVTSVQMTVEMNDMAEPAEAVENAEAVDSTADVVEDSAKDAAKPRKRRV